MNAAAGWYLSPANDGSLQYWDGKQWLDLEAPGSQNSSKVNAAPVSNLAIASLVSAFVAPTIVPIILGHLAVNDISKSGGTKRGKPLAIAGLVLGYLASAILILWLITSSRSGTDTGVDDSGESFSQCGAMEYYINQGTASDQMLNSYSANC
jgi:hypothetical protein